MLAERRPANSHKILRLARKMKDRAYRKSFMGARVRRFIAHQMRAIRGQLSQTEFGKIIEKPQNVVSRLENPSYGKMTVQNLIEIAEKTDRALVVQFVDWETYLRIVSDDNDEISAPAPFDAASVEAFAS